MGPKSFPKFEKSPKKAPFKRSKKWFFQPRNQNLTSKMVYLLIFDPGILPLKFLKNPYFLSFGSKSDYCRFQNCARSPPIKIFKKWPLKKNSKNNFKNLTIVSRCNLAQRKVLFFQEKLYFFKKINIQEKLDILAWTDFGLNLRFKLQSTLIRFKF